MTFSTAVIVLLVLAMIASLGSAMWYMVKDQGEGDRTAKALTARIAIWGVLFAVIAGGIYFGWITPSNTIPV